MSESVQLESSPRSALHEEARLRMLRLVTKSFCRELIDSGAGTRDLLKVSSQVLEFATAQTEAPRGPAEEAFRRFKLADVRTDGTTLKMGAVSLMPVIEADVPVVARWVAQDDIQNSMLVPYPAELSQLRRHLASPDCSYHLILRDGEPAGLIGAEDIDPHSRRMEMRKFIGEPGMRGRGLGTEATFLWLHHAFDQLEFNKIYIHTHHANARNIKLNRSLGFEVEGVLSQEHRLDGAFVDIVRMGLVRESWRALTG